LRQLPKTLTFRLSQETYDELIRIAGEGPEGRGAFVRRAIEAAIGFQGVLLERPANEQK
jgi:predicted DNA-binding protein